MNIRAINSDSRLHYTMNIFMILLIMTSVTLTLIESVDSIMTPELRSMFLAIHLSILCVFFAEFMYRFWKARELYPNCSQLKARIKFLLNPFTIIDIIVIAPLFAMIWTQDLHGADTVILRILRFTSILNMFHFYRSSRVIRLIRDMSREIWYEILIVFVLSLQCIIVSGVLFYVVEHGENEHVHNILDGIWWAVVTLTTIWYGDIYPITVWWRVLGMSLAMVGIGLVALPTGILTTGFIRALRQEKKITHMTEALEEEQESLEEEQDSLENRIRKIEQTIKKSKTIKKV